MLALSRSSNARRSKHVTGQLKDFEHRQGELNRKLQGLRGQLGPKRQELGKLEGSYHEAQPQLRRAAHADKIADMIDVIITDAFPRHVGSVAEAMTGAYLAVAHKEIVKRIDVEPDSTVKLLGGNDRNLRDMDASAGESQIFALSLIAAIAQVSERSFPIVMDTRPLLTTIWVDPSSTGEPRHRGALRNPG